MRPGPALLHGAAEPEQRVLPGVAGEDVSAPVADERVVVAPADQAFDIVVDVVALTSLAVVGVAVEAEVHRVPPLGVGGDVVGAAGVPVVSAVEVVLAGPGAEEIRPVLAVQVVRAAVAVQGVVAGAALERVVAVAPAQGVLADAALQDLDVGVDVVVLARLAVVGGVVQRRGDRVAAPPVPGDVLARVAPELVAALRALQCVVAGAAVQHVGRLAEHRSRVAAVHRVVAAAAVQRVPEAVALIGGIELARAPDLVVLAAAGDRVVAAAALEHQKCSFCAVAVPARTGCRADASTAMAQAARSVAENRRRVDGHPSGIRAVSRVPAPGGLSSESVSPSASTRSVRTAQPAAVAVGSPAPIVGDPDEQVTVVALDADDDRRRARVLVHVGRDSATN
jgi:hypothetical protein